ncbi:MAG: hypothetical protein LBD11_05400 [Candidatus Peribacteria bacterium]|nr:hypothetical protein [Candidatus Peribacteria bacterium]
MSSIISRTLIAVMSILSFFATSYTIFPSFVSGIVNFVSGTTNEDVVLGGCVLGEDGEEICFEDEEQED